MSKRYKDQVYIIANPMFDYYKIGRTKDIQRRLQQLNTGVPMDYKLVLLFEKNKKGHKLERELHAKFWPERLRDEREFFKLNPEQLEVACSIAEKNEYCIKQANLKLPSRITTVHKLFSTGFMEDIVDVYEWYDNVKIALRELEDENNVLEYQLAKGYLVDNIPCYYEDAIEAITCNLGGDVEQMNILLDSEQELYHYIEEQGSAYDYERERS